MPCQSSAAMIARGCQPSLWRSRLPSVISSHRVQSHFSTVPHLASRVKQPDGSASPLDPREKAHTNNVKSHQEKFIGFSNFGSSPHLRISEEVKEALAANRPIVALESTIYTHGLPYPDNAELAIHLENTLRDMGVIPATIGLVDGVAVIGMNSSEMSTLASAAGQPETMKVSRRDLPYIIGMGLAGKKIHGGTTVAATMYLAETCGIKVFATGGIGGVHRGGQDTMDVSADLTELGRTNMAVVASGCKSFLDIPRTLEFLETQGVTVATFSENAKGTVPFPAFYTTDSGVQSPLVVRSPQEAAAIIYAQELLGPSFTAGLLLANPIPEDFAISKAAIDSAIEEAVQEAAAQGFTGHRNTPFILARIKDLTKGKSVVANKALIESNVRVGGRVAQSLSNLRRMQASTSSGHTSRVPGVKRSPLSNPAINPSAAQIVKPVELNDESAKVAKEFPIPNVDVMVFGSLAVDLSCDYSPEKRPKTSKAISPTLHTSNISTINTSLGGVGHNVALAAHRASTGELSVRLCSYVADDIAGTMALTSLQKVGLDTRGIRVKSPTESLPDGTIIRNHTAQYVSINDTNKDLVVAMADMSLFSNRGYKLSPDHPHWNQICAAKWTVVDANWDPQVINLISTAARKRGSKVAYEPVSVQKSTRLLTSTSKPKPSPDIFPSHLVDLASPNHHELAAMHNFVKSTGLLEQDSWWRIIDALGIPSSGARDKFVQLTNAKMTDEGIPVQAIQLLPFIPLILTKLGERGVLHTELLLPNDPRLTDPASAPWVLSRCANGTEEVGGVYMRLYPAVERVEDVVSVNGVGDTFLGVLVAGLARGGVVDEELIHTAQRGAVMTLRSREAVAMEIEGLRGEEMVGLLD